MNDTPYTPSMPVPTVGDIEQARQAEVLRVRGDVMHGGAVSGPYADREPKWYRHWTKDVLMPVGFVVIAFALLAFAYYAGRDGMAKRVDELTVEVNAIKAVNTRQDHQIAAVEGNVEKKIDAYVVVEAKRLAEEAIR